jgi:tetratricopeptide (TPR) repeat protein
VDGDLLSRAEELRTRGVAANSAGRPAEARRLLGQALRLVSSLSGADARELRARVLMSDALAVFERSGLANALEVLDRAGRELRQIPSSGVEQLLHSQRALLLLRSGSMARALAELDRAAQGLPRVPVRDQVVILLNRGTLHMQLAHLEAGRSDLLAALALALEHGLAELGWKVQHNLGYLEYVAGDLPLALSRLAEVQAMVAHPAPWVPLDHGRVLVEAGLLREAQARFLEAETVARDNGLNHERGESLVELARVSLLQGDHPEAMRYAALAKRLFGRRGAEGWRSQAGLVAVMAEVFQGRNRPSVVRQAMDLANRFAVAGARDLDAYASLLAAEAHLVRGDTAVAESLIARASAGAGAMSYSRRLYADLVKAKAADARGDRPKARAIMRRASDGLARAQGRSSSLDVRAAVALHGRRLGDLALGLAVEEGSAARALEATERWQAISNRLPPVAPPDDPDLAQLTSQLRQLREQERGLSAERNRATAHIAALERRIRERDWHGVGSEGAALTKPVSVTALQRRLAATSAALASFFPHAGTIHAVVVTPRGSALVPVAAEAEVLELATRIQADVIAANQPRLHPAIASSVRGSLSRRLEEVDRALLGPLGLRQERLVVVPSYAVAGLPWGLLPSRVGRPTTVARSATTWASGDLRLPPTKPSVYAVAGPGLATTDAEVDAVAALWPSAEAVHAEQSTEAGLVQALRSRSVVHIAAHGEHQGQNPLFSSVRLSDGVLFAHELQHGGVTAEHVILSACDVGRATIRPGDEALGLTASLLALGAKNVVAAVAPVPDVVAHRVMTAYHRHLAAGLDVSASLAQASLVDELGGLFCSFGSDWAAPAAR